LKSQPNAPTSTTLSVEELNELIIDCIQDNKGKHVVKLDLRSLDDTPADFFIICEGDSDTQVRGIADHIVRKVKTEAGIKPALIEGQQRGKWVLVDYFTTVVHVFYRETREFYQLEDMWSDAACTEYESV